MNWLLRKLAYYIVAALIDWLKDPANRADVEKAAVWVAERGADVTPWQWDDKVVDGIANALAGKFPGLNNLGAVVGQLQALLKKFGLG